MRRFTGPASREALQRLVDIGRFAQTGGNRQGIRYIIVDGRDKVLHLADLLADFFDENGISWCNYAIGSDAKDDANALVLLSERYTDSQKYSGHWPDGLLSKSGAFIREELLKVPAEDTAETEEE